jgi:2-hydroxy-4-carboxymuconate semialdehyde hemiacetal dehydrogenase
MRSRLDDLSSSATTARSNGFDVSAVDVSMNGIEQQDRQFPAAIRGNSEPNASVQRVLYCYGVLHELKLALA